VLWRYAVHAGLVRPDAADEEVQLLTQRLTPGLGGYVILIVAGLFVPIIAVAGYLAIAPVLRHPGPAAAPHPPAPPAARPAADLTAASRRALPG